MTTTIADSIALRILNRTSIVTGVGNELHLHSSTGDGSTHVLPLQLRGKIHGIESDSGSGKLLVYGEKEFMLIDWQAARNQFTMISRASLSDWISAAILLEDKQFVLLTAHSVLLRFVYMANAAGAVDHIKLIEKSSCSDKSTLYCSHLHGKIWTELVVFGGNAFGELLIWRPTGTKSTLLKRVQMHNGVIFSIDYHHLSNILTTTSDDRSIRFWHVTVEDENWSTSQLVLLASGYGHVARVFQGKIINYANQLFAITVGEDSYFCIWRTNGELIFKRRQQFGATIWNFAYQLNTLFTVSSTGNLLAYDLQDILENRMNEMSIMPPVDFGHDGEYVAKLKFLSNDMLVGITSRNHMLFKSAGNKVWQRVCDFSNYKVTVLEVFGNRVVVCGYKRLTLYRWNNEKDIVFIKLCEEDMMNGVVRAFQFLDEETFIVSDDAGDCVLFKGETMQKRFIIDLPKYKERWLTTALMMDKDLLLLSNRQGNLMLYRCEGEQYSLKDVLKQPHGNLGATQLKLVESTEDGAYVKSAGHDGALRVHHIDKVMATIRMCSREVVPVAWVEHLLTVDAHELLLGFNDNHFVAWSNDHDFAVQVPCGGGHRCWDYTLHDSVIQLAFIKNKQVLWHKLKLFNNVNSEIRMPTRNKWHVKPCNMMSLIPRAKDGSRATVLVSAGDDNIIKISTNDMEQRYLTQKAEIHTHISNIRALRYYQVDDAAALIFSGGGRGQLCVSRIDLRTFRIVELVSHTLKAATKTPHIQNHNSKSSRYCLDPETRVMSCDIVPLNDASEFAIFLGCSDGFVRKLHCNSAFGITLESEIFYGKCVLQLRVVALRFVLVAATDGLLTFYDLNLEETQLRIQHHSSGVNALDVLLEQTSAASVLHVLSGGDDQSVAYTAINLVTHGILVSHNLKLHTAQVTAACLQCAHVDGGQNVIYAFTSGVDQNVVKYNLTTSKLIDTYHSCVADVKGLCVDDDQWCYLYGCGFQVFQFQS